MRVQRITAFDNYINRYTKIATERIQDSNRYSVSLPYAYLALFRICILAEFSTISACIRSEVVLIWPTMALVGLMHAHRATNNGCRCDHGGAASRCQRRAVSTVLRRRA